MNVSTLYPIYLSAQGVSTDTRSDLTGKIFFCLKGPNFDANTFAEQALKKGALHVVSDDPAFAERPNITVVDNVLASLQQLAHHHRKQLQCPVIGLTGSNGKTTHKELIAAVLASKYRTYFTQGNLNNHIGVPLTLLSIPPDAEMAVVEMGANAQREIKMLSEICDPEFGLITNIGKAHLEGFGGIEGVRKGKGELYDYLRQRPHHVVFINGDDHVLKDMATGMNTVTYGTDGNTFVKGIPGPAGETVTFRYQQEGFESDEIHTHLAGDFNFINLLAAVCIGRYFGVNHEDIKQALENYAPTQNRSQLIHTEHNILLMDAYNANPTSMKLSIENFARMKGDRKVAIIGQMLELGTDAAVEHASIVALLRSLNMEAILVGPYFETCNTEGFIHCADTAALATHLTRHPIKNATILLKGSRMVALEKVKPLL